MTNSEKLSLAQDCGVFGSTESILKFADALTSRADGGIAPKYVFQRNSCNCHPETCCCDDWVVVKGDERIVTCFDKDRAIRLVDALNRS